MLHLPLMALSPLDGRYANSALLNSLRTICSEFGLNKLRLKIEIAWLITLTGHPDIKALSPFNEAEKKYLHQLVEDFSEQDAIEIKSIERVTNHDLKSVEYFLREKLMQSPYDFSQATPFLHFACTSEDINNIAYALMLKAARVVILSCWDELIEAITALAITNAAQPMLSRTHGQPATPTTLGKELANFAYRLKRQRKQLAELNLLAKFNGAVGNYNAHLSAYPEINWQQVTETLITDFGLSVNCYTTQIEPHDYMAEFFDIMRRFNTILLNLSRDMWGYISINYFKQKQVESEVGSSTMPHKINPIDFENSEGNLGVANALLQHFAEKLPISRWQRDLSDSTVLRNIGVALGHSLIAYEALRRGLQKLAINPAALNNDLAQNWQVIAEAIQTVMRRYGCEDAYEQLKQLTRGYQMNRTHLHHFIDQTTLPIEIKNRLKMLQPQTYLGDAESLTNRMQTTSII